MTVNSNNIQANQQIQQKKEIEKKKNEKDSASKEEIYEGFTSKHEGPVAGLPFEGDKKENEKHQNNSGEEHKFSPLVTKDYSGVNPYVKWLHLYEASHGAYDGYFGLFKDLATSGETYHNAKTIVNTVKDKVVNKNNEAVIVDKTTKTNANTKMTNPIKEEKVVNENNQLSKKAKKEIKKQKYQNKKQQNALNETRNRKEYEINRNKYNNNLSNEEKISLKENKNTLKKVTKTKNANNVVKTTKNIAKDTPHIHNARSLPECVSNNVKILKKVDISLNETKQVKELVNILEKNGANKAALKLLKGTSSISVVAVALNATLEADNIYTEFQKGTEAGLKQVGRSTLNVGGATAGAAIGFVIGGTLVFLGPAGPILGSMAGTVVGEAIGNMIGSGVFGDVEPEIDYAAYYRQRIKESEESIKRIKASEEYKKTEDYIIDQYVKKELSKLLLPEDERKKVEAEEAKLSVVTKEYTYIQKAKKKVREMFSKPETPKLDPSKIKKLKPKPVKIKAPKIERDNTNVVIDYNRTSPEIKLTKLPEIDKQKLFSNNPYQFNTMKADKTSVNINYTSKEDLEKARKQSEQHKFETEQGKKLYYFDQNMKNKTEHKLSSYRGY
ncbi:MAG: hypothetical protein AB1782_08970 [Cyanobacteriota bacterium]